MNDKKGLDSSYILGESYDGERLEIVHRIDKTNFAEVVTQVLDEYGLAQRLEQAKLDGKKVQIVDIGCGEGLFMHDLAQILQDRNLLHAAEINGIDINPATIATAEEYARVSKPPRPYLRFYLHDATQPFETNPSLHLEGKTSFDFIYIRRTLEYLAQAETLVKAFYGMLKPGGVFHEFSVETSKGPNGWLPVHPALEIFLQKMVDTMLKVGGDVGTATEAAKWLSEAGAEKVQQSLDHQPVGGTTQRGLLGLRNIVMTIRNVSPNLIKRGLVTQKQYDDVMAVLFRELGTHLQGQWTFVVTLARKPQTAAE